MFINKALINVLYTLCLCLTIVDFDVWIFFLSGLVWYLSKLDNKPEL